MICCVDYNPYNLLLAIEYRYKYCNGKKDNNTIPVDCSNRRHLYCVDSIYFILLDIMVSNLSPNLYEIRKQSNSENLGQPLLLCFSQSSTDNLIHFFWKHEKINFFWQNLA